MLIRLSKLTGVLVLIFVVVPLIIFSLTFIPGSTKKLEELGSRFNPKPSWKMIGESIRPPKIACFNGGSCDSLNRVWELPSELQTNKEFQKIATIERNKLTLRECTIEPESSSKNHFCYGRGEIDGYDVTVHYSKYETEAPLISLNIEKAD